MITNKNKITVTPGPFDRVVEVPSSKSYANRVIILASLSRERVEISNLPLSHDVTNLIAALRLVGLSIVKIKNGICVENSFPECEKKGEEIIKIFPGDGGTTTRFLIPFLSLGKRKYQIEPEGRMRDRPIEDLLEKIQDLGVQVERSNSWLTVSGPMAFSSESMLVDASTTTQHATALALSFANKNVEIYPQNMNYSTSYWEMTKKLITESKHGKTHFVVPVDFSSMSYVLALGADLGKVKVSNCTFIDKFQSDSVFIEILKKMGCEITLSENGLTLSRSVDLRPIDLDCSNCPDLVPTLAFICSRAKGHSRLKNLSILQYKESDRLFEVQKLLSLFNVKNVYDKEADYLDIYGISSRSDQAVEISPPDDHRVVMASYLFLRANGGGKLSSVKSVSKSFANFFEIVNE